MKKLIFTLGCALAAGAVSAQTCYKSAGNGATVNLWSADNWLTATSPAGPWIGATSAPGPDASLSDGSLIIICTNDSLTNTLNTAFPANTITGVTIIDSSTRPAITAPTTPLRTATTAGNKIIFAGDINMPINTFFNGKTINCKLEIRGNVSSGGGALLTLADADSSLILASGTFNGNNGNQTLYVKGPIYTKGGTLYSNSSSITFNGAAVTLPANLFSDASGNINNQVYTLIVNNGGAGVTSTGSLYTKRLTLTSGSLTLGGTYTMAGGYGTYTIAITSGSVIPGVDTVIFKPVAAGNAQTIPANFFQSNSVANLHIDNTAGVTYSTNLGISGSLAVDSLNSTPALSVSGNATVGGKLVVNSFATAPSSFPATYTIVSSTGTLSGTFSSVSVPDGYNGTVTYNANSAVISITQSTALPVKLISFKAEYIKPNVNIFWKSGLENNLAVYNVERSLDGVSFASVATVAPLGSNNSYSYLDQAAAAANKYYYRIVGVDNDGAKTYSDIVSVYTGENVKNAVSLFPNPVISGNIHLAHPAAGNNAYARVIGVTGAVMKVVKVAQGSTATVIDVNNLAQGIYFVTYSDGQNLNKLSFIKQ